ncbi:MAG TPA: cation diffusion facilitator family transporter [Chryseolinea sp.]|nr:cation diffusion facilitator family transporter [Chryseolinea sp.]
MHDHDHSVHQHTHHHDLDIKEVNGRFIIGIVLNIVFVVLEFGAGFFSNSLGLMSDAGHNLSDVASLILSLGALKLLTFKATKKFTYGYRKASILISLLNALILLITVAAIGYESVHRILSPEPVKSGIIIWVALAGIAVNGISALLFFRDRNKDLNIKGAYLHLALDALVSVGVVVSGILIYYTQWNWIDPLVSLAIMVVIVTSTWRLLANSVTLSIDAVPKNIQIDSIRNAALKLSGIKDIHHIHVWAISTAENALTAHLVLNDAITHDEISTVKSKFKHELEHLGIQHSTLETEFAECVDDQCNSSMRDDFQSSNGGDERRDKK